MKNEKHWVYIIQSLHHPTKYYVGLTSNPKRRLIEHNEGWTHTTSKHKPWHYVFCSWFVYEWRAKEFERYLKTGSGIAFSNKRLK